MGSSGKRRARRSAKKRIEISSAMHSTPKQRAIVFAVFAALVGGILLAIALADPKANPDRVWSVEHNHWHDKDGRELQ